MQVRARQPRAPPPPLPPPAHLALYQAAECRLQATAAAARLLPLSCHVCSAPLPWWLSWAALHSCTSARRSAARHATLRPRCRRRKCLLTTMRQGCRAPAIIKVKAARRCRLDFSDMFLIYLPFKFQHTSFYCTLDIGVSSVRMTKVGLSSILYIRTY